MTGSRINSSGYVGVDAAHGIMFHHFHGPAYPPSQGSIDANQFADMIDFLGGHARIIDSRVWLEKALADKLEPKDLCLTFDDALLCQKEVAVPVLRALGYTAFFFVYSSVFEGNLERLEVFRSFRTSYFDNVDDFYDRFFEIVEQSSYKEVYSQAMKSFCPSTYLPQSPFYTDADRKFRFARDEVLGPQAYNELMDQMIATSTTSLGELSQGIWMRDEDLVNLANEGHIVGLHSYTHPTVITALSPADQEMEYASNFRHITRVLGQEPEVVSHPCNSYDSTTLGILTRLGIKVGFRATVSEPYKKGLEFAREDHANIMKIMGQPKP